MIINDLDLVRVTISPDEADAVLVVDPDAVLSSSIAGQRFEPIARERAQIPESARRVHLQQLSLGHPCNTTETATDSSGKQRLGFLVAKRANHLSPSL